ncbi:hypothetical protein GCM10007874_65320 [Labrys miyagiensis]|uniref:PcfJ-like protein n=1 Tax=Labrys miyagiensis TaxID=346912 RepID=A0ABQ6CZ45_9HYPH|nr:PcfJ domain-containing protein [Labrys miyagiensis]GLS23511.1 hypothetical protein GCM10007874_65320 [Labrys miyagiensis]
MARFNIQRVREAERARIDEAHRATLRRARPQARHGQNLRLALAEAERGFSSSIIRDPGDWHPQLKTRDLARLRLAAARHLFARYPVPAPLERIWQEEGTGLTTAEIAERKRWYIAVAQGGSLYKAYASNWLSRKEVHLFLNPPGDLSFNEALWQAVARSYTDDVGLALRIARSKIARMLRNAFAFWREVARFFCVHPAPLEEIDDLCDFLAARHGEDPAYSLKGRTPVSLRRQMHAWHRELAEIRRVEAIMRRQAEQVRLAQRRARGFAPAPRLVDASQWDGVRLQDWFWQLPAKEARFKKEEVMVVQLRTAADLVAESGAMRHCVSSYAFKCAAGNASIWSLRRRKAQGGLERMLTIELDGQNRAVQIRGFANRLAMPGERELLARWAKARNLTMLV